MNRRRRDHDPANWSGPDTPNRCLNAATTCRYGLAGAAILAPGYAPAIGLIHAGKPQSFVYDVADVYKFETVVPIAFEIAAGAAKGRFAGDPMGETRRGSRAMFRKTSLLERHIPGIEEMLSPGGLPLPEAAPEAVGPVFRDSGGLLVSWLRTRSSWWRFVRRMPSALGPGTFAPGVMKREA